MKIISEFNIDKERINDICQLKGIKYKEAYIDSAKLNLEKYKQNFIRNIEQINNLFSEVFNFQEKENFHVKILVFPKEVEISAVNCQDRTIFFSINTDIPHLDVALICHEISHILFYPKRKYEGYSMLVDEVIAYLIENEILYRITGRNYFTVWDKDQLDQYHKTAFEKAELVVNDWKDVLKGGDFLAFLTKLRNLLPEDNRVYKLKEFLKS